MLPKAHQSIPTKRSRTTGYLCCRSRDIELWQRELSSRVIWDAFSDCQRPGHGDARSHHGHPRLLPSNSHRLRPQEPTQTSISSNTPYWNAVTGGGVGPQPPTIIEDDASYDATNAAHWQPVYHPQAQVYTRPPPQAPPGALANGTISQPQLGGPFQPGQVAMAMAMAPAPAPAPSPSRHRSASQTSIGTSIHDPTFLPAAIAELPGESSPAHGETPEGTEADPGEATILPAAAPVKSAAGIEIRDISAE